MKTTDTLIDDKEAIQKVIDEHLDAVEVMDVGRILSCQTEDHLEMPAHIEPIIGKEAYKKYFAFWIDFFKGLGKKEMNFKPKETVVSGNWAFQTGSWSTHFVFKDGNHVDDEGNYVWIFRKEPDNQWKWARVISNSTKH